MPDQKMLSFGTLFPDRNALSRKLGEGIIAFSLNNIVSRLNAAERIPM